MAQHLICIELRDAPGYDYAKLHTQMEGIGFLTTYQSQTACYRLPAGTYHKSSDQVAVQVLEAVQHAVRTALKDETTLIKSQNYFPMILVSELKLLDGLTTIKVSRKTT
jgi:hypothetical protein